MIRDDSISNKIRKLSYTRASLAKEKKEYLKYQKYFEDSISSLLHSNKKLLKSLKERYTSYILLIKKHGEIEESLINKQNLVKLREDTKSVIDNFYQNPNSKKEVMDSTVHLSKRELRALYYQMQDFQTQLKNEEFYSNEIEDYKNRKEELEKQKSLIQREISSLENKFENAFPSDDLSRSKSSTTISHLYKKFTDLLNVCGRLRKDKYDFENFKHQIDENTHKGIQPESFFNAFEIELSSNASTGSLSTICEYSSDSINQRNTIHYTAFNQTKGENKKNKNNKTTFTNVTATEIKPKFSNSSMISHIQDSANKITPIPKKKRTFSNAFDKKRRKVLQHLKKIHDQSLIDPLNESANLNDEKVTNTENYENRNESENRENHKKVNHKKENSQNENENQEKEEAAKNEDNENEKEDTEVSKSQIGKSSNDSSHNIEKGKKKKKKEENRQSDKNDKNYDKNSEKDNSNESSSNSILSEGSENFSKGKTDNYQQLEENDSSSSSSSRKNHSQKGNKSIHASKSKFKGENGKNNQYSSSDSSKNSSKLNKIDDHDSYDRKSSQKYSKYSEYSEYSGEPSDLENRSKSYSNTDNSARNDSYSYSSHANKSEKSNKSYNHHKQYSSSDYDRSTVDEKSSNNHKNQSGKHITDGNRSKHDYHISKDESNQNQYDLDFSSKQIESNHKTKQVQHISDNQNELHQQNDSFDGTRQPRRHYSTHFPDKYIQQLTSTNKIRHMSKPERNILLIPKRSRDYPTSQSLFDSDFNSDSSNFIVEHHNMTTQTEESLRTIAAAILNEELERFKMTDKINDSIHNSHNQLDELEISIITLQRQLQVKRQKRNYLRSHFELVKNVKSFDLNVYIPQEKDDNSSQTEAIPSLEQLRLEIINNSKKNPKNFLMKQEQRDLTTMLQKTKLELRIIKMTNVRKQLDINSLLKRLKIVDPLLYSAETHEPAQIAVDPRILEKKQHKIDQKESIYNHLKDLSVECDMLSAQISDQQYMIDTLTSELTGMAYEPRSDVQSLCWSLKSDRAVINETLRQNAFVQLEIDFTNKSISRYNEMFSQKNLDSMKQRVENHMNYLFKLKTRFNTLRAIKEKRSIVMTCEEEMNSLQREISRVLSEVDVYRMRINGVISKIEKQVRSINSQNIRLPVAPIVLHRQEKSRSSTMKV
ncbi:hypothetical protein TRFO_30643 [Tritrichomonas foetus]|uniref:Uncharacterized protein n=1 Tax=Tritrichomonas foetus TaxID=1144522 RepID=A0A1J4JXL9_9EUKA|nr:hypothetical protein TRFO_30643 [Tritrichomonas foetus]|eukprot:OHT02276.1 hypothetical protein TRFO_30643 [Tritrichomonas foetus]